MILHIDLVVVKMPIGRIRRQHQHVMHRSWMSVLTDSQMDSRDQHNHQCRQELVSVLLTALAPRTWPQLSKGTATLSTTITLPQAAT